MRIEGEGRAVDKIGGTSVAHAQGFLRVPDYFHGDIVTLSFIGARFKGDVKGTDLLERFRGNRPESPAFNKHFKEVRERTTEVAEGVRWAGIDAWLDELYLGVIAHLDENTDWIEAQGEVFSAEVEAEVLRRRGLDVVLINTTKTDLIRLRKGGGVDPVTYENIKETLPKGPVYVVTAYSGMDEDGNVVVFPRGGADISSSVLAKGVEAELLVIWTDRNGYYAGDPELIIEPDLIDVMGRREARGLSVSGAGIVHPRVFKEIDGVETEVQVRNSFHPDTPFSRITKESVSPKEEMVVGIAGLEEVDVIGIGKPGADEEAGWTDEFLKILRETDISYSFVSSEVDFDAYIVPKKETRGKDISGMFARIREKLEPTELYLRKEELSAICVVGHNLIGGHNTLFMKIYETLIKSGIAIEYPIAAEHNAIVVVRKEDYRKASHLLYDAFIRKPKL